MQISARSIGNCVILDCVGAITHGPGTKFLHEAIREVLKEGPKRLVVNLEQVDYIDSTGIGELVSGYIHAQTLGGRLVLLKVGHRIFQLLAIARLNTVFEVFQEEEAALAGGQQKLVPEAEGSS